MCSWELGSLGGGGGEEGLELYTSGQGDLGKLFSDLCEKKIIFPKLKILIVKFLVRKQENILT